jgi:hypothetical protein
MTAVSSSLVGMVSNAAGCGAIASSSVCVPSMGDGAAGSAVMTRKCSQRLASPNPA